MVRSRKVKANSSDAHTIHTHTHTPKNPCRDTQRHGRADSAGSDHRGLLVFMSPLFRLSPLHSCVLTHCRSIIAPPRPRSDMKVPWNVWMCARPAAAVRSGTPERRGVCVTQRRREWPRLASNKWLFNDFCSLSGGSGTP